MALHTLTNNTITIPPSLTSGGGTINTTNTINGNGNGNAAVIPIPHHTNSIHNITTNGQQISLLAPLSSTTTTTSSSTGGSGGVGGGGSTLGLSSTSGGLHGSDIVRSHSVVEVSYCEGRHTCRFRNYRYTAHTYRA
jgi:hypothetical protein